MCKFIIIDSGGEIMLRDFLNQEINMKKSVIALMILGLVVTTSVTGFLLANQNSGIIISKDDSNSRNNMTQATSSSTENNGGNDKNDGTDRQDEEMVEEIKVYVVGEVNNPGVVTLKKGQIIRDAIELAGGPTEKADIENINMVYELEENVMLRVWSKEESMKGGISKDNQNVENDGNKGISIVKDSAGVVVEEKDNKDGKNSKININTASEDELLSLPGVGPSTAAKIISYREQNGEFKKIEDIMNVSGIGDAKFNQMKDFITVK
jgi:competence protein ComEA